MDKERDFVYNTGMKLETKETGLCENEQKR